MFSFLFFITVCATAPVELDRSIRINDVPLDPQFVGHKTLSKYHSTEFIHQYLKNLTRKGECHERVNYEFNTMKKKSSTSGRKVEIGYIDISSKVESIKLKALYLFGEHPRELVSSEAALYFVNYLCKESPHKSGLSKITYRIIFNGNPESRKEVEKGNYCIRLNPEGVDLNRNWDVEWKGGSTFSETNPGPAPFSEPETMIFRELVEDFQPALFLTVHSGTKGMYVPYAYKQDTLEDLVKSKFKSKHIKEMLKNIKPLDAKYCQCPYGGAGEEVQYPSTGTCIDFVFMKVKSCYHAYAFEIYTKSDETDGLTHRFKLANEHYEKLMNNNGSGNLENSQDFIQSFRKIFQDHPSDFIQGKNDNKILYKERHSKQLLLQKDDGISLMQTEAHQIETPENCFAQFNPPSDAYDNIVKNWSKVFRELALQSHATLSADNFLTFA